MDADIVAYFTSLGKRIAALERICGIYAQGNADTVGKADILTIAKGYPLWAADTKYLVGDIRRDGDGLYKCRQAHTSTSTWQPSVTPTLWEPIVLDHAGTQADPMPWTSGMTAHLNLYYSEGGKVYRCKRDDTGSGTALYYTISQLVGDYFEAVTV